MKDKKNMSKKELSNRLYQESLDNLSKIRYLKNKKETEEKRIKQSEKILSEVRTQLIEQQNKQIEINSHIKHLDNKIKYTHEGDK